MTHSPTHRWPASCRPPSRSVRCGWPVNSAPRPRSRTTSRSRCTSAGRWTCQPFVAPFKTCWIATTRCVPRSAPMGNRFTWPTRWCSMSPSSIWATWSRTRNTWPKARPAHVPSSCRSTLSTGRCCAPSCSSPTWPTNFWCCRPITSSVTVGPSACSSPSCRSSTRDAPGKPPNCCPTQTRLRITPSNSWTMRTAAPATLTRPTGCRSTMPPRRCLNCRPTAHGSRCAASRRSAQMPPSTRPSSLRRASSGRHRARACS